jgi:Acetyltransferases
MFIEHGTYNDIDSWMELVQAVHADFPGLETPESMFEHRTTVLKFMGEQMALCVKDMDKVVGVLLFSKKYNMICCLAVLPEYRKQGIANMLLLTAINNLDRTKEISVSTYREDDPKGAAPRALYKKFGFVEDELIEEFGYPNQRFILYPELF